MLLANKYDCENAQASQLGEAFANNHSIPLYFKISAKNGDKDLLFELFQRLADYIYAKNNAKRKQIQQHQFQIAETSGVCTSIDHRILQSTCTSEKGIKKSNCASCSKR